jgi:hypothetical protein
MKTTQAEADRAAEQVHHVLEGTPALRGYVLVLDFDDAFHVAHGGVTVTEEATLALLHAGIETAQKRMYHVIPTHGIPDKLQ